MMCLVDDLDRACAGATGCARIVRSADCWARRRGRTSRSAWATGRRSARSWVCLCCGATAAWRSGKTKHMPGTREARADHPAVQDLTDLTDQLGEIKAGFFFSDSRLARLYLCNFKSRVRLFTTLGRNRGPRMNSPPRTIHHEAMGRNIFVAHNLKLNIHDFAV